MSMPPAATLQTGSDLRTLEWVGGVDGCLRLIDQTRLPTEVVRLDCRDVETLFEAIRNLRVRGAPAIGVAAAYGVCIAAQGDDSNALPIAIERLASSRPTAVNMFWALERMRNVVELSPGSTLSDLRARLLTEARAIHEVARRTCREIGRFGATLLADGASVLTHCNAGGLATSEYGTALAVMFAAHDDGKRLHVFVDETRPLLQGALLTAWELAERGIDATLICDSMAAQVMREGRVQAVIVGADRIAANGDVANKIGTYGVAVLAAAHGIPFYVAAPTSTFDRLLATGDAIPIEQRAAEEITHGFGRQTAPAGVAVYNPAFDVTPARLVTAIICERGIIQPANAETFVQTTSGNITLPTTRAAQSL